MKIKRNILNGILSIILISATVICLTAIVPEVKADSGNNLTETNTSLSDIFTIDNGTLTIDDKGDWDSIFTILPSITIPNNVTCIGSYAFARCGNLKYIIIPGSVTSIKYGAFYGCDNLEKVIYCGTAEDFGNIDIEDNNAALTNAERQYHDFGSGNICKYCGYSKIHTHKYGKAWSKDSEQHWHECLCGAKKDAENHVYDNACDSECNVCGKTRTVSHSYGSVLKSDISGHWYECSKCQGKKDFAAHDFNGNICKDCGFNKSTVTKGDVNCDGNVNADDAIYLLYYVFFPTNYPVNQPCDFNGDTYVNADDAIYLLYHVFFPENYKLN